MAQKRVITYSYCLKWACSLTYVWVLGSSLRDLKVFFSEKAMNIVQTNVGTILCMLFRLENITMIKNSANIVWTTFM